MKIFKNILINILCLAVLVCATDFILLYKLLRNGLANNITRDFYFEYYSKFYKSSTYKQIEDKFIYNRYNRFRKVENEDSSLPPILIFSDCFSYGLYLSDNETYSYFLGKYSKRPIYNRGSYLLSVQHMLFQLKNEKFYELIPKPKDIIYTWKPCNATTDVFGVTPWNGFEFYYKRDINNKLYFHRLSIVENSPIVKILSYVLAYDKYEKKSDKFKDAEDIFYLHLKEAKEEVEKHWGKDVNFYIIVALDDYSQYSNLIKNFELLGYKFIYLDAKYFNDKKYFVTGDDNNHYSKLCYQELAQLTLNYLDKNK